MTLDLWLLVAAAALQWALILTEATPAILANGPAWAMGNREGESKPLPGWAVRAGKASRNLQENLILFAILVLVAHVAGKAGDSTALGAKIFVGARVAHALVYIAGVPGVRTLIWVVSLVGLGMIGAALA